MHDLIFLLLQLVLVVGFTLWLLWLIALLAVVLYGIKQVLWDLRHD